jgi:hypothetical protein
VSKAEPFALSKSGKTTVALRRAVAEVVEEYVAANQDAILARLAARDAELAALFAQIDHNLDASEKRTARLLLAA